MSEISKKLKLLFSAGKDRLEYFVQGAIIGFTEAIVERMTELEMSNSDLAKKLKCQPAYITKVLRGATNFTLHSMVKIALALDSEVVIGLKPKLSVHKWATVIQNRPKNEIPNQSLFSWDFERKSINLGESPKLSLKDDWNFTTSA